MKTNFYLSRLKSAIIPNTASLMRTATSDSSQALLQGLADLYPFTWNEINYLHTHTGKDVTITEKLLTYAAKNNITIEEAVELHLYVNYSA